MGEVRVECGCCRGAGTVLLSGVYLETYKVVRRLCKKKSGFVVSGRDCDSFNCKATALNNRLVALEKHGLVFSEQCGRERRFFPCAVGGAQ